MPEVVAPRNVAAELPTAASADYENYPLVIAATEPAPGPRIAEGAGRGLLIGMAAAALTIIAGLPPRLELEPTAVVVLTVMYTVIAAVIGSAPGAAVGAILATLARMGATRLPIRLIGGAAAATVAAAVSSPLNILNWPGAVVAALCGAFAAPWVAWGSDRRTLD